MSCPICSTELENFNHQEGGWCNKCETWFPLDIILETEEVEGNDPFWGEEEDLYAEEET